jgi:hypothetical protein
MSELISRGCVKDSFTRLNDALQSGSHPTVYAGFDPTADSLHNAIEESIKQAVGPNVEIRRMALLSWDVKIQKE